MPKSPLRISLDLALTGAGAPSPTRYANALGGTVTALDWLRRQHKDKALELLGIPVRTDDLRAATRHAATVVNEARVKGLLSSCVGPTTGEEC